MTFVLNRDKLLKIAIDLSVVLALVYALFPELVVFIIAFDPRSHAAAFPPPNLSLRWFYAFFGYEKFMSSLQLSLTIAFITATLSSLIALPCAWVLAKRKFRGKDLIYTFFLTPMVVPGVVIGGAMLTFFYGIGMRDAYINVMIAHILIGFPFVMRLITSSLIGFDTSLEEAAKGLGAGELTAFRKITLPIIMPGIVAGWVFGFISSFGNVATTAFLTDYRIITFQVEMLSYIQSNFDPMIAVASVFVMAITVCMLLLMQRGAGFDMMRKGI